VHFWVDKVAKALKKNQGGKDDASYSAMKELFGKALTKLLLNCECYEHLTHFEEIFNTLQDKGVVFPTLAAPLRKLMTYNIDAETTLDVQDVDLNALRRFYTSKLWKQFEKKRAVALLQKAKDEEHGEKRDRVLKMWDAVAAEPTCDSTKADVEMARSLFLSTIPLSARVAYALGEECRMQFAVTWKSDFDFGSLRYFGTTPSTFEGLTFQGFSNTYTFILSNDLRDLVKNAIMKATLDYGVSLAMYTKEKAWWPEFFKWNVATRLGLLKSWCEPETPEFDGNLVDAEIIEKVEKETVKFLANVKGERNWMTVLKNRSKEIKASKARPSCWVHDEDTGGQTESQAAEPASSQQTLQDSTKAETPPKSEEKPPKPTQPDAQGQEPAKPAQKCAEAAAFSGQEKSVSGATEAQSPQPAVGDIVLVRNRQNKEYDGCRARVLKVLTGNVKVEVLNGSTVGTENAFKKFLIGQVSVVAYLPIVKKAKADQTQNKKEGEAKDVKSLLYFMADEDDFPP